VVKCSHICERNKWIFFVTNFKLLFNLQCLLCKEIIDLRKIAWLLVVAVQEGCLLNRLEYQVLLS